MNQHIALSSPSIFKHLIKYYNQNIGNIRFIFLLIVIYLGPSVIIQPITNQKMINSVSDRIRSLIKTQDQTTPQSQLYRSRDNSIQSIPSGTYSRTNNHIPPKSPHKPRSHLHKSQISQENNQAPPKQDYSDLIEQIKIKVMELVYPLLMELSKKLENVTQATTACATKMQMQNTWKRVQNDLQLHFDKIRTKIQTLQNKETYEIHTELAKLDKQYSTLSKQVEKINLVSILSSEANNNTMTSQKYQKNIADPVINDRNREKSLPNQQPIKCKCEKLVQEILKSQNHLMMELKYVKHFQNYNQSNNPGGNNSKNYSCRGR